MAFNLKKNHLINWDLKNPPNRTLAPATLNGNHDDEEDLDISERSSIVSSPDLSETPSPTVKQLPSPPPPPPPPPPKKLPHNLRYYYNNHPVNGISSTTQARLKNKDEEKKTKKTFRKGQLIPAPSEIKSPEQQLGENHYPYWYYNKVKNHPDLIVRHRRQMLPHESIDSEHSTERIGRRLTPTKLRQKQREKFNNDGMAPILQYNPEKKRYERVQKKLPFNSNEMSYVEDDEESNGSLQQGKSSPEQYQSLKDGDSPEYREQLSGQTTLQQRRKPKIENEKADHYVRSFANKLSASPQELNDSMGTPSPSMSRSKHRAKATMKHAADSEIDKSEKHFHHPQQQQHHYQNHHVRRRPPSGVYVDTEFQVVDLSFRKKERSPYFQKQSDQVISPPPAIYNQSSYLPPIVRDHHPSKPLTTRFPAEYYGTLAQQTDNNWEEPIGVPKLYKPDPRTRFYDRYLNSVINKRLEAF